MKESVRKPNPPIFFFQAENDCTWFRDVLAFLQTHCTRPPAAAGR